MAIRLLDRSSTAVFYTRKLMPKSWQLGSGGGGAARKRRRTQGRGHAGISALISSRQRMKKRVESRPVGQLVFRCQLGFTNGYTKAQGTAQSVASKARRGPAASARRISPQPGLALSLPSLACILAQTDAAELSSVIRAYDDMIQDIHPE